MFTKNELKVFGNRLSDSKQRAKKKKWDHSLTKDDIGQMYLQSGGRCPYTKMDFILEAKNPHNISVDRIDSSKGYVKENCMLVSTWANKAKTDLPRETFIELCKKVAA